MSSNPGTNDLKTLTQNFQNVDVDGDATTVLGSSNPGTNDLKTLTRQFFKTDEAEAAYLNCRAKLRSYVKASLAKREKEKEKVVEEEEEEEEEEEKFRRARASRLETLRKLLGPGTRVDANYSYSYSHDKDRENYSSSSSSSPDRSPTKLPAEHCGRCSKLHSPSDLCDDQFCDICNSKDHLYGSCTYRHYIPKGAYFNRQFYEVRCQCGCPFFDEDNWFCNFCYESKASKIYLKDCEICHSITHDHNTFECPKDKERAALLRSKNEMFCQRRASTSSS